MLKTPGQERLILRLQKEDHVLRYLTLFLTVLLVPHAYSAGVDNPRERLSFLIGEWTIEGREDSLRDTCAWFHNRSHVLCTAETRAASGLKKSVSVFSYSEELGHYLYYHYGSSGVVAAQAAFFVGETLTTTSERRDGRDVVREQVWVVPRTDGSFDLHEDVSRNGGPWTTTVRVRYVPINRKPAEQRESR